MLAILKLLWEIIQNFVPIGLVLYVDVPFRSEVMLRIKSTYAKNDASRAVCVSRENMAPTIGAKMPPF
jgi:hypothetical protein